MVRCKFKCNSKREFSSMNDRVFDYEFTAVYGDSPENKEFWKWTPSGKLNVSTVTDGQFSVGVDYFLDISEAN